MRLINPLTRLAPGALATMVLATASSAWAQSTLDHLVVHAPSAPVTVHIFQGGAGKLGSADDPITLVGAASGPILLTVQQIGTFTLASQIRAYTAGSAASTITLKQQTADATPGGVNGVWAQVLLGTPAAPAAHQQLSLLQTGDKAQACIESVGDHLSANIVQHGSASGVSILNLTSQGANNTYGSAGVPITLGALSTLTMANTGDNNRYAVSLADASTANIANTGSDNTYNIATQLAGDALALTIAGAGNTFTFDFPTIGTGQYQAVAWGNVAMPVSVNNGDFVAQCGGSTCWVTDITAANLAAAASASVTPR